MDLTFPTGQKKYLKDDRGISHKILIFSQCFQGGGDEKKMEVMLFPRNTKPGQFACFLSYGNLNTLRNNTHLQLIFT